MLLFFFLNAFLSTNETQWVPSDGASSLPQFRAIKMQTGCRGKVWPCAATIPSETRQSTIIYTHKVFLQQNCVAGNLNSPRHEVKPAPAHTGSSPLSAVMSSWKMFHNGC